MSLAVALTPGEVHPADVTGATVFVIDILRATTTMCAAFHHGAESLIPAEGVPEARAIAAGLAEYHPVLAGERGADPIPGFDLGNSPDEMTRAAVGRRLLVMTTTNGTRALMAVQDGGAVHPLAAVNFSSAVARGRAVVESGGKVLVVCAGIRGEPSREDAYCAGRFAREVVADEAGITRVDPWCLDLVAQSGDDWYAALMASTAGRKLSEHGYAADVQVASRADLYPVLPVMVDGRLRLPAASP